MQVRGGGVRVGRQQGQRQEGLGADERDGDGGHHAAATRRHGNCINYNNNYNNYNYNSNNH